jgi:hypothetical protein
MNEKDLDLDEIEARLKAKPFSALVFSADGGLYPLRTNGLINDATEEDLAFLNNAPTDIAALVARVRELETENKARFTEGAKETKERVLSAIDMAGLMEAKFGTKDRARVIAEIKLLVQSIEVEVE